MCKRLDCRKTTGGDEWITVRQIVRSATDGVQQSVRELGAQESYPEREESLVMKSKVVLTTPPSTCLYNQQLNWILLPQQKNSNAMSQFKTGDCAVYSTY